MFDAGHGDLKMPTIKLETSPGLTTTAIAIESSLWLSQVCGGWVETNLSVRVQLEAERLL